MVGLFLVRDVLSYTILLGVVYVFFHAFPFTI